MHIYKENKRKLLKTNHLLLFVLLLMLSSCDMSKRITYFQDIQEQRTTYTNEQARRQDLHHCQHQGA